MSEKDGPRLKPQIFGGNESSSSQPEKLSSEEILRRDVDYIAANPGIVLKFRMQEVEINESLLLDDFKPPTEAERARVEVLQNMTFADIVGIVLDSHRSQWRKDPSFYRGALIQGKLRISRTKSLKKEAK